ncbi:MAG: sigma-54 dependent transcriptional regulator [Acidobacteria bacterium]|nr:sigma-54 dependent transcriptional regulator [Acidobacteriota bacterium]
MSKARILIVDDEAGIRQTLRDILEDEGHSVAAAADAVSGQALMASDEFDLVLLDVWLPDRDGLEILEELREGDFQTPVIVISGHGNIDTAVKAMRIGAHDFLEKPLALNRVVVSVENALERKRLERQVRELSNRLDPERQLIGDSPSMRQLKDELKLSARAESRILITGENGTGKELVARRIHSLSQRRSRAFVEVNCAAIPEELIESELFGHIKGAFTGASENRRGRFEQADGGTLFLDEIADMSLNTQAKVLRVLEEQRFERVGGSEPIEVDVRVLAATNKNLEESELPAGRFREDLYFRLAVIPLHVPALRERRQDIPALIDHFLERFAAEAGRRPKTVDPRALERLVAYSWPGNVRELRNLSERLMIMAPGDVVMEGDLPPRVRGADAIAQVGNDYASLKEARETFERLYIERRLGAAGGNVSQTARDLGVDRRHLYRKLQAYGIDPERGS